MSQFGLQINNKDGSLYRKYTKDTLHMLFSISPTAANFELMIVIEGVVFMGVRSFYIINKQEQEYDKFIADKSQSTFSGAIQRLYMMGIIDEPLKEKLITYKTLRNEIAHDWFQIKTVYTEGVPSFKEFSHDESLKKLFDSGLDVFVELGEVITPGRPTTEEYLKRFQGQYRRDNK
jgi:DNA-binding transcriptional ArsR family regulator